jgi:hypothetical protein
MIEPWCAASVRVYWFGPASFAGAGVGVHPQLP